MTRNKHEAKAMIENISFECRFNSTTSNSNQKWHDKTCQCEYKKYCAKKNIVGIQAHVFLKIVNN